MGTYDQFSAFERFFMCDLQSPAGLNRSGVCDERIDALIQKANETFDTDEQDKILNCLGFVGGLAA